MARFEIIDSVGLGYRTLWYEREYLLRLSIVPIFINFLCINIIVGLDWSNNLIRQALVMLPAYFTEGWMASHLVRYVFYDQKWPFKPTGKPKVDIPNLQNRASGIMTGTLLYVVVQFLFMGFIALSMHYFSDMSAAQDALVNEQTANTATINEPENTTGEKLSIQQFAILVLITTITIWSVRLFFVFIPGAANLDLKKFMKDIKSLSSSFYFIGIWLICFLPVFIPLQAIIEALLGDYISAENMSDIPSGLRIMSDFLKIIAGTIILILTSLSVASAIKIFYTKKK